MPSGSIAPSSRAIFGAVDAGERAPGMLVEERRRLVGGVRSVDAPELFALRRRHAAERFGLVQQLVGRAVHAGFVGARGDAIRPMIEPIAAPGRQCVALFVTQELAERGWRGELHVRRPALMRSIRARIRACGDRADRCRPGSGSSTGNRESRTGRSDRFRASPDRAPAIRSTKRQSPSLAMFRPKR